MAKGMHRDIGAMDSASAVIVKFPCMNMMESSSSLNQSSGRQLPYIMRKANIVSNTRRTTSNRELGRKLLRYICMQGNVARMSMITDSHMCAQGRNTIIAMAPHRMNLARGLLSVCMAMLCMKIPLKTAMANAKTIGNVQDAKITCQAIWQATLRDSIVAQQLM